MAGQSFNYADANERQRKVLDDLNNAEGLLNQNANEVQDMTSSVLKGEAGNCLGNQHAADSQDMIRDNRQITDNSESIYNTVVTEAHQMEDEQQAKAAKVEYEGKIQ